MSTRTRRRPWLKKRKKPEKPARRPAIMVQRRNSAPKSAHVSIGGLQPRRQNAIRTERKQADPQDTARKFFSGECPIAEVRRLMETATAYDPALWAKLAEQGFTGII